MYEKKAAALGFSLIEIMVATVLMGLMGALLMISINSSVNAKDNVEAVSSRYQIVRQAMSRMSREISMAYLSKHMKIDEPTYITQFKGYADKIYFSAFGHVVRQKDAHQSDQQVLGFYLADDKKGVKSLMRSLHPNLNLDVEKGGRAQVLCPNVSALTFSYYDGRLDKWEDSWSTDTSSFAAMDQSAGNKEAKESLRGQNMPKPWRLPGFVKISMTVDMGNGEEMTWVSQLQIPIQEPLDLN